MKIYFSQIKGQEKLPFNSTLDNLFKADSLLKKINSGTGNIAVDMIENVLTIKFSLVFNMDVVSSYTGDPFNTDIKVDDTLYFTNSKALDSDDLIYVPDEIDLDNYAYSLLITSIPIDIHKKDEVLSHGEGYRVLKEEDLNKEMGEDEKSSPFDSLKNIDFDN